MADRPSPSWASESSVEPATVIGSATSARLAPITASHTRKAIPNVPRASAPPARAISTPRTKFDAEDSTWSASVKDAPRAPLCLSWIAVAALMAAAQSSSPLGKCSSDGSRPGGNRGVLAVPPEPMKTHPVLALKPREQRLRGP